MTREEAKQIISDIDKAYRNFTADEYKALELAIKALSQEPCDDVISREWLKTAIHNFYYGLKHTPTEEDIQAYIDVAPPVTQKSGKWILQPSNKEQGERDFIWWKCSECGQVIYSETEHDRKEYHAFCGRCGADMRGDNNE